MAQGFPALELHGLRPGERPLPGTRAALREGMKADAEPWSIPVQIFLWSVYVVAFVMAMVVVMLH